MSVHETDSLNFSKLLLYNIMGYKLELCYTALIFVNHFTYGVTVSLIGATLVDLIFIYDVSLNTIFYIPIAISLGYFIGSQAGWLYKWLNHQLMLIFTIFLVITITFIPFYGALWITLVARTIHGIGDGAYDAASSVWIVEMWPENLNTGMLKATLCLYGLGTIVAPILVSPFVNGKALVDRDNKTLTVEGRISGLQLPFEIIGAFQVVAPIMFFILYCFRPYKNYSQSASDHVSVDEPALDLSAIPHRAAKLALCGLCLATYATAEFGYFTFSTTMFQYLEVPLSAAESAFVMSILSTTYTLGRLLTEFIGIKLSPDCIITYHYITLLSSLSILFFGRNNLQLIYLGTALLGYGFSAMWPALFAFTEKFTSLIILFVMSQLFEEYPLVLLIMVAIFVTISLAIFVVMRIWVTKMGKLPKK